MTGLREERFDDHAAVRAVVAAAFGRPDEAALVDRLREDGAVALSLVAEEAGEVVGHLLFTPLPLVGPERTIAAAALAPLSVAPGRQGRGIGSALVREGLARLAGRGVPAVVVLGHPGYYPRFGFRPDLAARLVAPFSGDALMALELAPGALVGCEGFEVRYASAFGIA
jgi:putative acetyltransferase